MSRSAFENCFYLDGDLWVRVGIYKNKDDSYMISRYCRTKGIKGSKLSSSFEIRMISSSCSSWAFWRSFARALEWSNSCMFGSLTRLGHLGNFKRLLRTCMMLIDIVSCIYNKQSAKQCDWTAISMLSLYIIIVEYCWPAGHIYFSWFGMSQAVP